MSYPSDEPDLDAVCEFLGLVDDAESHATYATEAHRCYRLPNPTRIAGTHQESYCLGANHTTCPVFLGEGVAQTTRTATAPPVRPPQNREAGAVRTAGAPPPQGRPRPPQQRARPGRETTPGALGPRPRPGGISMPAATIGLLVLAIAIVGLAFLVQSLLGGGDDPPAGGDPVATRAAQTQTAQAGAQSPETSVTPGATTPGTQTPGETTTPGGGSPTTEPTQGGGGDGEVHVVQAGEFCSTIVPLYDITVEELIAANPELGDECAIFEGQELTIP